MNAWINGPATVVRTAAIEAVMFHFGIGSRSWMEEILDSNSLDPRPASLMRVNKTRFLRERQEYQVITTGVDMTVIVPNQSK